MANRAFALSEAKTKSSVCPAHMSVCLSMGARDNVAAEISDSVTPFCDFLLSVLSGLASFPASSGVFCSLTLPSTSKLCTGWLLLRLSPGQSSPSFECVTASLCCCTWSLPSLPSHLLLSRLSDPSVQGKAPGKPRGSAPSTGFHTDSQRVPDNL